eukprot:gene2035-1485_t
MLVVFITMTVLFLMELLIHTSLLSLVFAYRGSMQTAAFLAKPMVLFALFLLIVGSRSFDRNSVLSLRWARFYTTSDINETSETSSSSDHSRPAGSFSPLHIDQTGQPPDGSQDGGQDETRVPLNPKPAKTDYADEVVLATFPCYRHLRFYRYIFVGMLLLNFGLFLLAVWSATSRDSSQTLSNNLDSPVRIGDVDGSASSVVNGRFMTYQICDADVYSLNIGDLAYLMEMTYFKLPQDGSDCGLYSNRPSQLEECLQMYFSANYTKPELNHQPYNWKVLNMTIPTGSAVLSHNSAYYVAQSAAAKVIVIGIRGSTTGRDWLEDASLYSEISTLQAFSLVVPITALLPPSFIARLVKAMTFMSTLTFNQNVPKTQGKSIAEAYYADVEDVYDFYRRQYGPQGYVFLTVGHSLGGAVAGIVGARNGIRSIGFDPPGMVFSRSKFDISDFSDIVRTATVMVRQYDPVPLVDKHATVQYLDCPASYYDAYCHYSHPISCHLLSNCGLMNSVALDAFGGGYQYCGLSPTEQPSGQPTSTPTSSPTQPSGQPSSTPTSSPTL